MSVITTCRRAYMDGLRQLPLMPQSGQAPVDQRTSSPTRIKNLSAVCTSVAQWIKNSTNVIADLIGAVARH